MTNEELALQIRAGERGRITELWARVPVSYTHLTLPTT